MDGKFKYERELVEFCKTVKPKAVGFIVIGGVEGNSFDVRAVDEEYFRRLPAALVELASKIEGTIAQNDLKRKALEMELKKGSVE